MKQLLIIVLLTCACVHSQAQVNYVLNPSLEDSIHCPYSADQISFAKYWNSLDTTINPDSTATYGSCAGEYCNTCSIYGGTSVPINGRFNHYPRTGNGLAQVQIFYDESISMPYPSEYRDYMQGHLYKPLTNGKSYCITYFVCLEQASGYTTNNIDAYLDDGTIDTFGYNCGYPHPEIIPQILESDIITDTLNWTKIQGSFVSDGTERFITIGNFHDKAHTIYMTVTYPSGAGSPVTWYLVDDVSVIESDNIPFAGNDTAIHTGDSVFLGPHEIALPYTWYVLGNAAPIDSGGGMWVHPDSTTTYVLEQNLCGTLTYDTVKVTVGSVNVENVGSVENVKIYPNPAHNEFSIGLTPALSGGEGVCVRIFNMVGQEEIYEQIKSPQQKINIAALRSGIYLVQIVASDGSKKVMRVVKE